MRMVVTDLDDTLLSPEKTISKEAVRAIRDLERRNIKFTFITGRPPYAVERFAREVLLTAPVVSCNGAVIYDRQTGAVIKSSPLSLNGLRPLLQNAAEKKLTVLILAGGVEYAFYETNWTRKRKEAGREVPLLSLEGLLKTGEPIYKVNVMNDEGTGAFGPLTGQLQTLQKDYSIALYEENGCEIVAKGVNKGTGLQTLCALCGIPEQEVLAIGDNANDNELLRAAGIGAAVGNASKETKACADYVCENAYTEGVLEAIGKFIGL